MYSFLTVILLSQYPPDRNTLKSVKRYSFDKGYRFNLRGFSTGHMALVSMEDRKITCNRAAAKKVKLLKEIFEEVDAGKARFDELCEKKDVKPFSQKRPYRRRRTGAGGRGKTRVIGQTPAGSGVFRATVLFFITSHKPKFFNNRRDLV